jgi:hypothetical protein
MGGAAAMKRLAVSVIAAMTVGVLSAVAVSAAGVAATLSCSDGFQTTYLTDATGLLGLQSSVDSLNTSPLGGLYSCRATQTSTGPGSPQSFAIGGGFQFLSGSHFGFAVHQQRDGTITGQFQTDTPGTGNHIHGTAYCLNVVGNLASFGVHITEATDATLVEENFITYVEDNGHGNPIADDITSGPITQARPGCPAPFLINPAGAIQGNILVHMGV